MDNRPGREVPKEYREVIARLIEQGWRYDNTRKGHPVLYPADKSQPPLAVPTTPSDRRGYRNWLADIRRRGGNPKE